MPGIIPAGAAPGQTLYASVMDMSGQRGNGSALEAYNQAHWGNYVISAPEQSGSGNYIVTVPGYLPAGRYVMWIYIQLGGSPAVGDTTMDFVFFDWDGGSIVGVVAPLNVGKINGSAPAAVNLGVSALGMVTGVAASGTLSTSQMTTNLASAIAGVYKGRIILFTSGGNLGRAALITDYAVTGGKLTFVAYGNTTINVAPSPGDTFIIV